MKSSRGKITGLLRGTTLDVYRFMIESRKPVGVRAVQRALNLSSPSVARYHLVKLAEAKIVKIENGNYVVCKFLLGDKVKVNSVVFPRFLCYAIIGVVLLVVDLILINAQVLIGAGYFGVISILILLLLFCFETVRCLGKNDV